MKGKKNEAKEAESPAHSARNDISFSHKDEDEMEVLEEMMSRGYYSNKNVGMVEVASISG